MPQPAGNVTVTIPAGQSLSNAGDLTAGSVAAIIMSPDWTPANLSIQISNDNTTFADLYDAWGNEVLRPVGAGRAIMFDSSLTHAALWIKLRSGPTAGPVPQQADRVIKLVLV